MHNELPTNPPVRFIKKVYTAESEEAALKFLRDMPVETSGLLIEVRSPSGVHHHPSDISCSTGAHNWTGCMCSKCGKNRDKDHRWKGSRCSVCEKSRPEEEDIGRNWIPVMTTDKPKGLIRYAMLWVSHPVQPTALHFFEILNKLLPDLEKQPGDVAKISTRWTAGGMYPVNMAEHAHYAFGDDVTNHELFIYRTLSINLDGGTAKCLVAYDKDNARDNIPTSPIRCRLGFHGWKGCLCPLCGKKRVIGHRWINYRCADCGFPEFERMIKPVNDIIRIAGLRLLNVPSFGTPSTIAKAILESVPWNEITHYLNGRGDIEKLMATSMINDGLKHVQEVMDSTR